jgi:peptide/nickel transport system permease protein
LPKRYELLGLQTLLSILIGIPLGFIPPCVNIPTFDYIFTIAGLHGFRDADLFLRHRVMILGFSIIPRDAGWIYVPAGLSEAVAIIPLSHYRGCGHCGVAHGSLSMHLILPLAVLTMVNIAGWSRFVRASMLEVMRQDYVRTARAKGLG